MFHSLSLWFILLLYYCVSQAQSETTERVGNNGVTEITTGLHHKNYNISYDITSRLLDISLHTFRACLPRPSFLSGTGNWKAYGGFILIQDVACCTWPYHLSHRQRRTNQCLLPVVVKLRVFLLCLWCHRSNGSWHGHCGRAAAVQGYLVPTFCCHRA